MPSCNSFWCIIQIMIVTIANKCRNMYFLILSNSGGTLLYTKATSRAKKLFEYIWAMNSSISFYNDYAIEESSLISFKSLQWANSGKSTRLAVKNILPILHTFQIINHILTYVLKATKCNIPSFSNQSCLSCMALIQ